MPYTNEMAANKATVVKATVALSKLRLFTNALTPNVNTVKANFEAAEADFDGYTPGGNTITAFLAIGSDPGGGYDVPSPSSQFVWAHDTDDVGNLIGGWWLELAAGGVWAYATYPEPIGMAKAGDTITQLITLVEGRN